MDDEAIISLFFARSENAIAALDKKYGSTCRRISRQILPSIEDVDEVVSDAYLGVWNAIPPARPDPLSSFLYKIVRYLSLKRRRRNSAQKRNTAYDKALEELGDVFPSEDTPETVLEQKLLTAAIERFLDGLSPLDRTVFLRRYWFCEPSAAIAQKVGLSEKAVSVRLVRIRKALRIHLTEKEALL